MPQSSDTRPGAARDWAFLTNHAAVLVCIANDPGMLVREIGERVGITERAAHRIVSDLVAGDYVVRQRKGRRNVYVINDHLHLPDRVAREHRLGALLGVLTSTPTP